MDEQEILPLRSLSTTEGTVPAQDDLHAALLEKERTLAELRRLAAGQLHLVEAWRRKANLLWEGERALRAELAQRRQAEETLYAELLALSSSRAWRILQRLRRWRQALAPKGTQRARALSLLFRTLSVWRREGAFAVVRRTAGKVARKCAHTVVAPFRSLRRVFAHRGQALGHHSDAVPAAAAATSPRATAAPASFAALAPADLALLKDILALPRRAAGSGGAPIDVIVPVYRGLTETLRCLQSVLAAKTTVAHEVIVIDDAGPEPELTACLRALGDKGLITYLENPVNLGFVRTVNRGMALHPDRDVLLLNSDTEVYGDWLGRLSRAAYSAREVGTVTPLSNNATICSYPHFCEDNPIPPELTPAGLDALCASLNAGQYVDVPTAVGFCMYIRRDCLEQVGAFNAEHFGKGYGEENDFCMRALYRDWRHLLTTDTFVRHHGGTSFGASKNPAVERATQVIDGLHPDYHGRVQAHVRHNPALALRRRLDLARLGKAQPTVLYVTHNRGGGTERHVVDMAARIEKEGCRALILRPVDARQVRLECGSVRDTPNLVFAIPEEYWTLRATLRRFGIFHVHVQHTIDLPREVMDLVRDLGVPYDWTAHDYLSICPRINLIDESGIYCGEPGPAACNACLAKSGSATGRANVEIEQWRAEQRARLTGARKVFVPHQDVGLRLARYFPEIEFTERRHLEVQRPQARPVGVPFVPGSTLCVAVIGMIGAHKGSQVLLECARDAAARGLPLHFHIVGFTDVDAQLRPLPNVSITGRFREGEAFDLLERARCHCTFLPSVCPETYSFVLSLVLQGRLFPVAFDLGAPAARIRACGVGHLLPLTTDPAVINAELLGLRERLAEPPRAAREEPAVYETLLTDYYHLPAARAQAA